MRVEGCGRAGEKMSKSKDFLMEGYGWMFVDSKCSRGLHMLRIGEFDNSASSFGINQDMMKGLVSFREHNTPYQKSGVVNNNGSSYFDFAPG